MEVLRVLWTALIILLASGVDASKVHIVYMGQKQYEHPHLNQQLHHETLASVLGSKEAALESMVYSYKHGFSGFAAKLSQSQAKVIADLPGVACVLPNKILSIHTTHSWEFLQLTLETPHGLLHNSRMGADTIVGVLDTGIWPESQSFDDSYVTSIPSRWKGICEEGESFNSSNCNRKIIGARWYIKAYEAEFGQLNQSNEREFLSPRDAIGHGTHTSSTAAGAFVHNASFIGLAPGSARGGAPGARIATYKVCWATGDCSSADILAAFDDAINDGVDVISISLGSPPPLDAYFEDPISIGSFHALEKGIVVVCSAGNSGPYSDTVTNTAPWLITVAASTIDRSFPTAVTLGNNQTFKGQALYAEQHRGNMYSVVYAEDIALRDASASKARSCEADSLNATLAKGKFVLCFQTRTQKPSSDAALNVHNAKGIGVIYAQIRTKTIISSPLIPTIQVDFEVGTSILSYIRASRYPVLRFTGTKTVFGKTLAPQVAFFSSRGPSSLSPSILKPDIAAPGVNILAAWTPVSPPSEMPNDRRIVNFNIVSGTSMACPHVSGIVSLLKTLHPRWSPAAIRSALVTTASVADEYALAIGAEGAPPKLGDPFDYGGGHVNPNKTANPGLVYDMEPANYIPFLCSMGYNQSSIRLITGKSSFHCSRNSSSAWELNLPSISIPNLKSKLTVTRTVTNVGPEWSKYKLHVESPMGVGVNAKPKVLSFNPTIKKLSFKITFKTTLNLEGRYTFGAIVWSDGEHSVRSPIVVRTLEDDSYPDRL